MAIARARHRAILKNDLSGFNFPQLGSTFLELIDHILSGDQPHPGTQGDSYVIENQSDSGFGHRYGDGP